MKLYLGKASKPRSSLPGVFYFEFSLSGLIVYRKISPKSSNFFKVIAPFDSLSYWYIIETSSRLMEVLPLDYSYIDGNQMLYNFLKEDERNEKLFEKIANNCNNPCNYNL